ncbi:MAG: YfhO family protein [Atopobiaceae bacterium]|jgi:uncharacterized membrane protein YfhO|nr:YfhO family protein [Atopobiaceae bacterium]MCH4181391.1 YfhO family protein [Atopobiaceae bacterium]MCH4215125.1 YfhO family protein [Atopobiaceae bacterium]MCH4230262.1 YfhO family protein [Atopobiaceae bacterium]MCH4276912.1 YfhO family protein [Atopobiaceae bacterium]
MEDKRERDDEGARSARTTRRVRHSRRGLMGALEASEDKLAVWEQSRPGRFRAAYWRCYNRAFLLLLLVVLGTYLVNGRSIVWRVDGLEQYYQFFAYEGEWLRGILSSLLSGQGLQVPLWTWDLGYGADIPTTLDVIFDPVNLFSALVPVRYSEYAYQACVVLRLYLAGIAFSAYALRRGSSRFGTLAGAMTYAFSATLLEGLVWPGSMVGAILFPLVLLGVEKVLAGERPYLLIGMGVLLFVASYYYGYIIAIFLVAYCLVRVRQVEGTLAPRVVLSWAVRIGGCLVLAIAVSAFSLVPAVEALTGMSRFTSSSVTESITYSLSYYLGIGPGLVSGYVVGSDCYVGYGAVALLACASLLCHRHEHRALRIALVACTAMLLVPLAGSIMNGGNYATNRWVFVYAALVSYVVSIEAPRLLHLERHDLYVLIGVGIGLAVWTFVVASARTEGNVAALFCVLAVLLVLALDDVAPRRRRYLLMTCLVCSLSINAFYFIDSSEGGVSTNDSALTAMYTGLTSDNPTSLATTIDDDSFWRLDVDPAGSTVAGGHYSIPSNSGLLQDLKSYNFYSSIYDSDVDRFHTELGLCDADVNFLYDNLGGRSALEAICSTKYYLVPDEGDITAAYGYDTTVVAQGQVNGESYKVYEADDALPLGFTYSSVISRSTYDSLSMAGKQEALLQGCVVSDDEASSTSVPTTEPTIESTTVDSSVVSSSGCSVSDGSIKVDSAGATVTLSCAGLSGSDTYLQFTNLQYESLLPSEAYSSDQWNALRWYQKAKVLLEDQSYSCPSGYRISASADKGSAARFISNSRSTSHMYGGKTNWLLDLGYSDEAQSTVTLTFNTTGIYTFDSMDIVCQPQDGFDSQVVALGEETMQDTVVGCNSVTGDVSLSSERMLYFSIPYSSGWTATVDGEPATLIEANTAFMALDLPAGEHTIELHYMTPGLREGAAVSMCGLAALVGVIVLQERHRRGTKGGK